MSENWSELEEYPTLTWGKGPRDWQVAQKSKGLCILCAEPQHPRSKQYCDFHMKDARVRARNRYRLKKGIPSDSPLYTRSTNKGEDHNGKDT